MRLLLLIGLAGLLLGQNTYNLYVVGHYLWDYERYATELCSNKDRPEMHCNGSCHLMQEVASTAPSEAPALPEVQHIVTWFEPAEAVAWTVGSGIFFAWRPAPHGAAVALSPGWPRQVEHPPGRFSCLS